MKKVICCVVAIFFFMTLQGTVILTAAIASELASSEESSAPVSIYSKEDLQETLITIRNNLEIGASSETELILLENIMNELEKQFSETKSSLEEDGIILPDAPAEDSEDNLVKKMSMARSLIDALNNIITASSIEQTDIDTVLDLIEALDSEEQEVQGEILAVKPELPTRRADTKANIFKKRPIKYIGYDVTDADLAETDEIFITPAIEAKAAELGNNFIKIYSWVKNNIDYEPYYGSMKGSNETLVDMAGNDCDQASLLIALLRATGRTPAKYIRGDKELTIEALMNWVGVKMPEGDAVTQEEIIKRQEAAVAIMRNNKIPIEAIYDLETGEIESVIFDHISVALYNGNFWGLVNPSLKTYVNTKGVGGLNISKENIEAFANAAINFETYDILSVNQTVVSDFLQQQVNAIDPSLTPEKILGKREILVSQKIIPPLYLARGLVKDERYAEESSEMWDDLRYKVEVTMPGGNQYVAFLSELAGKGFSLVYTAANEYSQAVIDYYGIYNIPLRYYNVQMRPTLRIDDKIVAEGASIGLGLRGQYLKVGFLRPGASGEWEYTNKSLLAGSVYGMPTTTQKTSLNEVLRLAEALNEKVLASGLSDDDETTNDMKAEALHMKGSLYFALVDEFLKIASGSLDVVSVNHISMAYVVNEIKPVYKCYGLWFWRVCYLDHVEEGGGHIDVVRNVMCSTSTTGNRDNEILWMGMCGFIGTNMEHAIWEMLYKIKAVSTGAVFAKAAEENIKIHVFNNPATLEAGLAAISAYDVVKNHIRAYVNAGYTAMIPQRAVTIGCDLYGQGGWYGHGWMVFDPDTGSAGYMICGGLHGETTMANGGSLTDIIDDAIDDFLLWLLHAADVLKATIAPMGIMIVAGRIMYAAYMISTSPALPLAVTIPAATFVWLVGISLVAVATVSFLMLLDFFLEASLRPRRKKYAYAYA
ncbi:transglutaminase domain-containing protein [Candidatus Parcubacteria bacterium]|nr:transglutaminase domain-containing protein [Candidatus Parcubacteria bacterium]